MASELFISRERVEYVPDVFRMGGIKPPVDYINIIFATDLWQEFSNKNAMKLKFI